MATQQTDGVESLQEEVDENVPVSRACDLCESTGDPEKLPCHHRFCQPCLELLQATQTEGHLSCAICGYHAPLPQNGDLEETEPSMADSEPTKQPASNHLELQTLALNSVQEELLSDLKAPSMDKQEEATTEGKAIEQPEDEEYFLCLNNTDVKRPLYETEERELLPEPPGLGATDSGPIDDSKYLKDLNNSKKMSSAVRGQTESPISDVTTTHGAVSQSETTNHPQDLNSEEHQHDLGMEKEEDEGGLPESKTDDSPEMEAVTAEGKQTGQAEVTVQPKSSEEEEKAEHDLGLEREQDQGGLSDLKMDDMLLIVTSGKQTGPAEEVRHSQHRQKEKKGSDVNSLNQIPDGDTEKQPKESSSHHKKGKCKCLRGDVKTVHCSVCQKYVCLHCATHDHKDHSVEEIQEALDREKNKIKQGLDVASTCAEAHAKTLEELTEEEQNLLKQFETMSITIAEHSETALSLINERTEGIIRVVQDEAKKARESVRAFKAESLESLLVAFQERREKISEEREVAQVAFAAASSYRNISRKILDDGSSAVVLTSSNSLSEVLKTLKAPEEKTRVSSAIPSDYDRSLSFMAPPVDISREVQKWFGKVLNGSSKAGVAEEAKTAAHSAQSPTVQQGPTLIATLKSATTQLHRTFSVASDDDNDIIVAGQNIVRIFNNDTLRLKNAVALAFNPEGLAAYGDEIFVTGNGHNIHVLKKSGDSRRVLHVEGVQSRLQGLAVDSTGRIIVTEDRQVSVLLPDGTTVHTFDVPSEGGPARLYPATNSSDQIIVSDEGGHTIRLFDAAGNLIGHMGGKGKDDGQLLNPGAVCTDVEDNIIVADTKNNRVCQFHPDGTFDRHLVLEENYVRFPWGVAVTRDGRLVVSSLAVGQAVKVFDLHKNS